MNLLQRPDGMLSLLQNTQAAPAYADASGEIFGILKQMQESFETNLASSRKDEAEGAKSYGELKSAKEMEIKAATEKAFNKESEAALAPKQNAEAKEGLENTRKALAADTAFLASLKEKCAKMDEDWDERTKTRGEEIAAVSDTIAFLTEDDAKDLFSKSLGLVQIHASSQRNAALRAQAVQYLVEAGKKTWQPSHIVPRDAHAFRPLRQAARWHRQHGRLSREGKGRRDPSQRRLRLGLEPKRQANDRAKRAQVRRRARNQRPQCRRGDTDYGRKTPGAGDLGRADRDEEGKREPREGEQGVSADDCRPACDA